jgi:hypothetical protein
MHTTIARYIFLNFLNNFIIYQCKLLLIELIDTAYFADKKNTSLNNWSVLLFKDLQFNVNMSAIW